MSSVRTFSLWVSTEQMLPLWERRGVGKHMAMVKLGDQGQSQFCRSLALRSWNNRLLNLSVPQFLHLWKGHNSTYLIGMEE